MATEFASPSVVHNAMMLNFIDGNFVVSDGTDAIEISRRDASVTGSRSVSLLVSRLFGHDPLISLPPFLTFILSCSRSFF
jgi:hypothetical protein